jgi:hypothetical protein
MLAPADLGPPTQVQAAQSLPGSLTVLGKALVPARKAVERAWVDVDVVANWLSDDRACARRRPTLPGRSNLGRTAQNAHCASGASRIVSNRAVQGIAQCERALAIERNYATATC